MGRAGRGRAWRARVEAACGRAPADTVAYAPRAPRWPQDHPLPHPPPSDATSAAALTAARRGTPPPSLPGTHDLLASTLTALSATVDRVIVTGLHGAAYHARVCFSAGGGAGAVAACVDARPSDGFALALRFNSPILVTPAMWRAAAEYTGNAGAGAGRWSAAPTAVADSSSAPSPWPLRAEAAAAARAALAAASFDAALAGLRAGVAAAQERYADAAAARDEGRAALLGSRPAALAAALEAALLDGRLEDAATLASDLQAQLADVDASESDA